MLVLVALHLALAGDAPTARSAEDLVGTWNVTMKANYSTCKGTSVGDLVAQQWVLSLSSGAPSVQVLGGSYGYGGTVDETGLHLHHRNSGDLYVTVDLGDGGGKLLTGRRVVAKDGPCAVIYDVEAKKL